MATVTFSGVITAQAQSGETVTITVKKPDGTTETLMTVTKADLTYITSKQYNVAGNYSAKMHMDADMQYSAIDTLEVPFVVNLENRTGTLTITITY